MKMACKWCSTVGSASALFEHEHENEYENENENENEKDTVRQNLFVHERTILVRSLQDNTSHAMLLSSTDATGMFLPQI